MTTGSFRSSDTSTQHASEAVSSRIHVSLAILLMSATLCASAWGRPMRRTIEPTVLMARVMDVRRVTRSASESPFDTEESTLVWMTPSSR